jgi:hypothetical protein
MLQTIRRGRSWLIRLSRCVLTLAWLGVAPGLNPTTTALSTPQKRSSTRQALSSTSSASGAVFAYFFDLTGDFDKIALATGEEAAHGQIPPAVGIVEPFQPSGFDGCVFCGARYDRSLGRLYTVTARQARTSEDGTKHHQIAVLELPEMQAAGAIDMGKQAPSAILVRPDGKELLVSYQSELGNQKSNIMSFNLSFYSTPTLKLLRTIHETTTTDAYAAGAVVKAYFSEKAYFGPRGTTIYDQFDRTAFAGDKMSKDEVNPFELLAESGDKRLEPYRQTNLETKRSYFAVGYADSAAGKVLMALNAGKNAPQAVLTVDLDTHSLSPVIKVAQVTVDTAHLTPDGRQILFEESELRHPPGAKLDEPQQAIFRTGRLLIFNTATGEKVREIRSSEVKGFDSRLLCISPDDGLAFFAARGHLFGVNLVAGTVSQERTIPEFVFDRWTQCVLADR